MLKNISVKKYKKIVLKNTKKCVKKYQKKNVLKILVLKKVGDPELRGRSTGSMVTDFVLGITF